MGGWRLRNRDLKRYPHFDCLLSPKEGEALATDPARVAKHTFYPFMRYFQRWNRFAQKGQRGKSKERPIRYAARSDAYILSYYRHILAERYEVALRCYDLDRSVLAYRRIPEGHRKSNKCNIHFARDAVLTIRELKNCCVVALDISSFFETIDHALLKCAWCRILDVERLPDDHFQIFKAITKYAIVDNQKVYERLGHFGEKRRTRCGKPIKGYLTPYNKVPKQLCTGKEFRRRIAGGNGDKSLIEINFKTYGIPQGAPISDLLANIYLLDFDRVIAEEVRAIGGTYYRYSDDILIIAPGGEEVGRNLMVRARGLIRKFGSKLEIKEEKSSIFVFEERGDHQIFKLVHDTQRRNGLEYLGFRYDGRRMYLRDSTLSNLYRKIQRAARRKSNSWARRYPDKDAAQLRALFDYEGLIQGFGRVKDFGEKHEDYRNWTFWTYARRSAKILDTLGKPILRQLKNLRTNIRRRANKELDRAVLARQKRAPN
jgi:hypothetical protein